MCIWVAAYLKQAAPDLRSKGITPEPTQINSTPELGDLSVVSHVVQDAPQKGVKRFADKTPKDTDSPTSEHTTPLVLKQVDHKILKRTLIVTGPALLPYNGWDRNKAQSRALRSFAREQSDSSDAQDFSQQNIQYFDIQRPRKVGVSIARVPQKPARLIPREVLGNLDEMYGRGDTADFERLTQVFNAPAAAILLRPREEKLLFQDEAVFRISQQS